ncbi:MAG: UDP-N-acetylmuramoyl-L-alanyl-D-glutamate--2,6-diaminopimelate ligase [Kiritimatiellae bacterium]|nr:UDP-N-acetylmuramoyl-L-alanyl-D-glutamate--2,6-diaminopimelate ligase [Kiritimatiellia bacterium]
MRFWGITGTNGKTTTAWVFAEFVNAWGVQLRARERVSEAERADGQAPLCGYITTVEAFDGARHFYTGYTTPPLAQLKEIYAAMEANGCTDCVMEVSSHAIHQNRVGFGEVTSFSGGAFTNISEDHLDYHKTMEEYFRVKLSFAEQIARGNPSGRKAPFAVCIDGEGGERMYEACRGIPGLDAFPVTAKPPAFDFSGLQLVGDYNKSNVALAAALALVAGVPYDAIQRTIPLLRPRWGRLELVENPSVKAKVYVDFAHTPDGLEKVLSAARGFTPHDGRLWVVFGAGGDRDPMKRPLMGEACARLADSLVVTSDNPRSEDPATIIDAIVAGVDRAAARPRLVRIEPDRREAIFFALANAASSDVVIIAGKGHETTQEIKGVKHPFDDREVVRSFSHMV